MNRTITLKLGALVTLLMLAYTVTLAPVSAHGDEEHEESVQTEMTVAQMEEMIKVLQQLVALLAQYKAQYGTYVAPASTYVAPVGHEEEHEEETEHDEAAEHDDHDAAVATEAKLVIEIESHTGKTHVHVRYTDKTEEMFFVDTVLSNESGVVADIATRTGLSADAVKAALKYTGMNN